MSTNIKSAQKESTQKKANQKKTKQNKKSHQSHRLNLNQENEIFEMVVNPKKTLNNPAKKSQRKTSSNLPTNNNSKNQTPKTSIDLSPAKESYIDEFSKPGFHKKLIEKTSFRKYSDDEYSANKAKADNFKIKYKTELCKYYEINGTCKFGDNCAYAHGKENLRAKVTKATAYRTKNCIQFFENGFCPYGNRCQFAHAIKSNILNNPYDKDMSYLQMINLLSKKENLVNIKDMNIMQRLPVFDSIVPNERETKSTLFDDIKQISLNSPESVNEEDNEGSNESFVLYSGENESEAENSENKEDNGILQMLTENIEKIIGDV